MSRAEIPNGWTPLQEAEYRTVHEFKRGNQSGAAALGPMLGKSPAVLSNEVNPAVSSHKHGLEDSVTLQLMTEDYRILLAYSQTLNHIAMPMPEPSLVDDVELLNQFAHWQACLGTTCQEIHRALMDQRIEAHEAQVIRSRGSDHIRAFLTFLDRLDQLVEDE